MTQVQCEISEKFPLTPPKQWGTLLPLNSNSIYYCHKKLKLKGGFPFLSDKKTKREMSRVAGMGTRSHGLLVCTGHLSIAPHYFSRGPFLSGPILLSPLLFPSQALILYVIIYVFISVGVQNLPFPLTVSSRRPAKFCICFVMGLQYPAQARPTELPINICEKREWVFAGHWDLLTFP